MFASNSRVMHLLQAPRDTWLDSPLLCLHFTDYAPSIGSLETFRVVFRILVRVFGPIIRIELLNILRGQLRSADVPP